MEWANPPEGFLDYVKGRKIQPATVPWNQDTQALLEKVQGMMATQPWKNSPSGIWKPNFSGDCRQKAVAAREILRQQIPEGAIRFWEAKTENGEDHQGLMVTTDQGDKILDNRALNVVNGREQLPYTDWGIEYPGYTLWQKY